MKEVTHEIKQVWRCTTCDKFVYAPDGHGWTAVAEHLNAVHSQGDPTWCQTLSWGEWIQWPTIDNRPMKQ